MRGSIVGLTLVLTLGACGGDGEGNIDPSATPTTASPDRICEEPQEAILGRMNDATFAVYGEARPPGADGTPGEPLYLFIGTAWAVRDHLLATNAHVTEAYKTLAEQGLQLTDALAVQSRTGSVVRLIDAVTHPNYTGNPLGSPDIGLFTTPETLPVTLPLATDPDIRLGDEIHLVGFPVDVNEFIPLVPGETVPQATSLTGQVTALRSHDLTTMVTNENLDVIQHQAPTTPGTSGSSMMACDEVIAVNNAGTVQLIVTPGEEPGDFEVDRAAAAANNFGVHVRHLQDLLDMVDARTVSSFDLPVTASATPAEPTDPEPISVLGTWQGRVEPGPAEHTFAFAIDTEGDIIGVSEWPETGQFDLTGRIDPDGNFEMTDNAPERLNFRRGVYQGQIDMAGNVVGIYFEETMQNLQYQFQAQQTR